MEDSIEHYSRCKVVRNVFLRKLRIDLHPVRGLAAFFMATPEQNLDNNALALSMLGVYATFMCVNHYRHANVANACRATQYMGQTIIQGVQGHQALTKLLDR